MQAVPQGGPWFVGRRGLGEDAEKSLQQAEAPGSSAHKHAALTSCFTGQSCLARPTGAQTMQQQFKEMRMAGRHIPARLTADACARGFTSQRRQSLRLVLCVMAGRSRQSPSLDKAAVALSTLCV